MYQGETEKTINTESGFGWLHVKLILLPVKVQEICSIIAEKRISQA